MTTSLPIYDILFNEVTTSEDLPTKQKDEYMKTIKLLDHDGHERIYALIRLYQLENSDDKSTFTVPYKGKFEKNDIKFGLDDLPNKLKHMLYKFVQIHYKTMKEEITCIDDGIGQVQGESPKKSEFIEKPKEKPKKKTEPKKKVEVKKTEEKPKKTRAKKKKEDSSDEE